MEIYLDETRRVVEYRQTRRERADPELRERLRPLFRLWRKNGYYPLIVPAAECPYSLRSLARTAFLFTPRKKPAPSSVRL